MGSGARAKPAWGGWGAGSAAGGVAPGRAAPARRRKATSNPVRDNSTAAAVAIAFAQPIAADEPLRRREELVEPDARLLRPDRPPLALRVRLRGVS